MTEDPSESPVYATESDEIKYLTVYATESELACKSIARKSQHMLMNTSYNCAND
jgi:hypothetical protein